MIHIRIYLIVDDTISQSSIELWVFNESRRLAQKLTDCMAQVDCLIDGLRLTNGAYGGIYLNDRISPQRLDRY